MSVKDNVIQGFQLYVLAVYLLSWILECLCFCPKKMIEIIMTDGFYTGFLETAKVK